MGKFENFEKVGIRNKETHMLLAVYPDKVEGSDEKIVKKVTDWFYMRSCGAEEELRTAFVDGLTPEELKERK